VNIDDEAEKISDRVQGVNLSISFLITSLSAFRELALAGVA